MYTILITAISGGKPGLYRDPVTNQVPKFRSHFEAQQFIADRARELSPFVTDIQFRSSHTRRPRRGA